MDITKAMEVSAAGMKAQGTRIKVIAENLANAESTAEAPGDLPYRRKVVTFKNELDRQAGVNKVRIAAIGVDRSDFVRKYDPGNPVSDQDGYVMMPNVNNLVETMDLQEAQRSYDANLSVIDAAKTMLSRTVDLLR